MYLFSRNEIYLGCCSMKILLWYAIFSISFVKYSLILVITVSRVLINYTHLYILHINLSVVSSDSAASTAVSLIS